MKTKTKITWEFSPQPGPCLRCERLGFNREATYLVGMSDYDGPTANLSLCEVCADLSEDEIIKPFLSRTS